MAPALMQDHLQGPNGLGVTGLGVHDGLHGTPPGPTGAPQGGAGLRGHARKGRAKHGGWRRGCGQPGGALRPCGAGPACGRGAGHTGRGVSVKASELLQDGGAACCLLQRVSDRAAGGGRYRVCALFGVRVVIILCIAAILCLAPVSSLRLRTARLGLCDPRRGVRAHSIRTVQAAIRKKVVTPWAQAVPLRRAGKWTHDDDDHGRRRGHCRSDDRPWVP
mmetsp:Transcript_111501/g.193484  ORF Transcript_111501/g.193484 Transcript_111501/m.193484 type:complete len:220 (-) Transcript_111501:2473-3132(-)